MVRRALALTLAAAWLVGCGGGMSLEDYFGEVAEVRDQLNATTEQLQQDSAAMMETAADEAAQLAAFRDFLERSIEGSRTAVDRLKELEPPEEARTAHDAFVSSFEEMISAMEASFEDSASATNMEDAFSALASQDVLASGRKLNAACDRLQEVADANDVGTDLRCTPDQTGGEGGQASPPP